MPKCAIENCPSTYKNKKLIFYRLPKDATIRKKWMKSCKFTGYRNYNLIRICSLHFKKNDFIRNSIDSSKLKDTAVPSIFKSNNIVSNDYSLLRSQKRDIRRYLIDTQRRVAIKRFLDSFFDRRQVLTFLSDLYNNPTVVCDKNKQEIQRMRNVIRKLNRKNKKLTFLCNYYKDVSAAKTESIKNLLIEKQKLLYLSIK